MNRPMLALIVGGLLASSARADLGTLRLSTEREGRRISVFTSPAPLRAGPVEVKVLVQGEPSERILIVASQDNFRISARTQRAELFEVAWLGLPRAGEWHFEVQAEDWQVDFRATADEATPGWQALAPWVAWPIAAIGLFIVHQWLKSRGPTEAKQ